MWWAARTHVVEAVAIDARVARAAAVAAAISLEAAAAARTVALQAAAAGAEAEAAGGQLQRQSEQPAVPLRRLIQRVARDAQRVDPRVHLVDVQPLQRALQRTVEQPVRCPGRHGGRSARVLQKLVHRVAQPTRIVCLRLRQVLLPFFVI